MPITVMLASPTENTRWAYGYFRVVEGALLA